MAAKHISQQLQLFGGVERPSKDRKSSQSTATDSKHDPDWSRRLNEAGYFRSNATESEVWVQCELSPKRQSRIRSLDLFNVVGLGFAIGNVIAKARREGKSLRAQNDRRAMHALRKAINNCPISIAGLRLHTGRHPDDNMPFYADSAWIDIIIPAVNGRISVPYSIRHRRA